MYKYLKTFTILNYMDAILTYLVLSNLNDPRIRETNPVCIFLFSYFGMLLGLFILKTIGIIIFCYLYYSMIKEIKITPYSEFEKISKKVHINVTQENLTKFINKVCIFLNIIYLLIVQLNIKIPKINLHLQNAAIKRFEVRSEI